MKAMAAKKKNKKTYYLSNQKILKADASYQYTREEIEEYRRCMADPIHFIENHVKVIHPDKGLTPMKLYPYQKKLIKVFHENRFVVTLASRQAGKSLTVIAFILWYVIFNPEQNVAMLANKGFIARELLSRFKLALEELPFFLQPGVNVLNKGSIEFANNSKIFASNTSPSSIRGTTCVTGDTVVTIQDGAGNVMDVTIDELKKICRKRSPKHK